MPLEPPAVEALQTFAVGFAFAGCLAYGFELFTSRAASFRLLQGGGLSALACVPVVVFAAPFILVRTTMGLGGGGGRRFALAMLAAIAAGLWSLASGRFVLDLALPLSGT